MTRDEALALGLKRYSAVGPCQHGHVAERYVADRKCVECSRIKCLRRASEDRAAHAAKARDYYDRNRDAVAVRRRAYLDARPDLGIAQKALRKARKLQATPSWYGEFDEFVMAEAADLVGLRNKATLVRWHVDHMIPLQSRTASGLHCATNLQVIPAVLNVRKHNRMVLTQPLEWLSKI